MKPGDLVENIFLREIVLFDGEMFEDGMLRCGETNAIGFLKPGEIAMIVEIGPGFMLKISKQRVIAYKLINSSGVVGYTAFIRLL